METVLVTGANRGLGLEFCRQYAEAGWRVLACCRDPAHASSLKALAERNPQLRIFPLDVGDHAQIDALAQRLESESIDILLNNAGIYGDSNRHGFGALDYDAWLETFRINTLAAVKMTEVLLPQVQRSRRRLIVAVSSLMGSMTDNSSGGNLLYRSSKAALNAAMKSLAIDLKPQGIGVLILHPGWVQTDMGGMHALTSPAESIAGMRRVIDNYSTADAGAFINFEGWILPW